MGIMLSPEDLRHFSLFAGLDHAMLKSLAMASEEIQVSKGEWLFHEGDVADALYLIFTGEIELKIALGAEDRRLLCVATLVEGEVFGWSALVEPYTYKLGAIASKDSRLGKMNGVQVCELMVHHPASGCKLISRLLQTVGGRLNELRVRFVSLVEGGPYQNMNGGQAIRQSKGDQIGKGDMRQFN